VVGVSEDEGVPLEPSENEEDGGDALAPNEDEVPNDDEAADAGSATDGRTNAEVAADGDAAGALADANVWRYLRLGAIGLLSLLALVATLQLYWNASAAIGEWVAPAYVPVFQAAFNLVVLLLALAGLAVLARRRFS